MNKKGQKGKAQILLFYFFSRDEISLAKCETSRVPFFGVEKSPRARLGPNRLIDCSELPPTLFCNEVRNELLLLFNFSKPSNAFLLFSKMLSIRDL